MESRISLTIVFAVLLASFKIFDPGILLGQLQTYLFKNKETHIVVVLSARENFARRQLLRDTWLSLLQKPDATYYFIVGDKSCQYPMADRKDPFSCEFWNVSSSMKHNQSIPSCTVSSSTEAHVVNQGFDFKVHHEIEVNRLGVLKWALPKMFNVSISIIDLIANSIVAQAFLNHEDACLEISGYCMAKISPLMLHKDFEGRILVEGRLFQTAAGIPSSSQSHHFMSILQVVTSGGKSSLNSFKATDLVAPMMSFKIKDFIGLDIHLDTQEKRFANWKNNLESVSRKLSQESIKFKDILFVDLVDTYRNLPQKILKSFSWLVENKDFVYVLKTDDDCMINFPSAIEHLESALQEDENSKIWFGSFRKSWRVDQAGKWAERDYKSFAYPPFACGSGSFLSKELVSWIAKNSQSLHSYQGEDTSLGIWLSAIKPNFIDNDLWSCDKTCESESLSQSQLSMEDMKTSWEMFQQCGSICEC